MAWSPSFPAPPQPRASRKRSKHGECPATSGGPVPRKSGEAGGAVQRLRGCWVGMCGGGRAVEETPLRCWKCKPRIHSQAPLPRPTLAVGKGKCPCAPSSPPPTPWCNAAPRGPPIKSGRSADGLGARLGLEESSCEWGRNDLQWFPFCGSYRARLRTLARGCGAGHCEQGCSPLCHYDDYCVPCLVRTGPRGPTRGLPAQQGTAGRKVFWPAAPPPPLGCSALAALHALRTPPPQHPP
jgi:hypothetical protein